MGRTPHPVGGLQEFGLRVRRLRSDELGWSLERLSEKSGIHWTYISELERGRRNPSLRTLFRLADALGVDPGQLVTGLKA